MQHCTYQIVLVSPVPRSLLIAGGFLFFGQLVVPNILAQPQLGWKRFGFAYADFATFVKEFLNKGIICVFFGNLFHNRVLLLTAVGDNRVVCQSAATRNPFSPVSLIGPLPKPLAWCLDLWLLKICEAQRDI